MPLGEKGVRGKGRSPCPRLSAKKPEREALELNFDTLVNSPIVAICGVLRADGIGRPDSIR